MRIGMVADIYLRHTSGVTTYISLCRKYMERAGHEVYVFTFGDPQAGHTVGDPFVVYSPGLPVLPSHYPLALDYSRKAKELLRTMDIVHVHHPFLSGRLAVRACRSKGIPLVFSNHTRYEWYARSYLPFIPAGLSLAVLRSLLRGFANAMSLVVSPSESIRATLRAWGVRVPIEVVPNGVDLSAYRSARALPRADVGFDEREVLLICVGRLAAEKNLEFLLRAFQRVAAKVPEPRLLLAGGGSRSYENELRRLVQTLGIGDRVRFLGPVNHTEIPAWLAMCDVFVTTSVSETFGLSTAEAMAAGLPVAGIQSPGVGDIVIDGETGYLSAEHLADYAEKLARLCTDRDMRRRMGEAGRRESLKYDMETVAATLLHHYAALVNARAGGLDSRLHPRGVEGVLSDGLVRPHAAKAREEE